MSPVFKGLGVVKVCKPGFVGRFKQFLKIILVKFGYEVGSRRFPGFFGPLAAQDWVRQAFPLFYKPDGRQGVLFFLSKKG